MRRCPGCDTFTGSWSLFLLAATLAFAPLSAHAATFPDVIALPDGWLPEGVATGRGPVIYSGSRADGAIYAADLRTGAGAIVVPGVPGRVSVGLSFDARTNYIFAAGGGTGKGYIYDPASGALVREYTFTTVTPTFVNDVIVTRDAAYFTDSRQAVFYRVPLGPGGRPAATFEAIPLSGDFVLNPAVNNANGIEATPNGKDLIFVASNTGTLYHLDPATGVTKRIDLGGVVLANGDGLLLHGRTLYVVQNRLNQIAVVELARDLRSGVVTGTITNPNFDVPTTIAAFGNALYAVNARFTTTPTPTTTYNIARGSRALTAARSTPARDSMTPPVPQGAAPGASTFGGAISVKRGALLRTPLLGAATFSVDAAVPSLGALGGPVSVRLCSCTMAERLWKRGRDAR
jgi:sugar lactone lactonase YvrE